MGLQESTNHTFYFDRNTTNVIKGIAILMMFAHHFFTFPEWWGVGISYPLIARLAPYFCQPLRLCVAVFCFLTGYCYALGQKKNYIYSLRKITDLLIAYWAVFCLFALAAVICADYHYSWSAVLTESFGLTLPTMCFCWYVSFYCLTMLILPLTSKFMGKHLWLDIIVVLLILPYLMGMIQRHVPNEYVYNVTENSIPFLPCVLVGYITAEYGIFEQCEKLIQASFLKKVQVPLSFIVMCMIPMGRFLEPELTLSGKLLGEISINLDILYAPIFIYCIVNLCKALKLSVLKCMLGVLGDYSLLMWFVSCIFFGNSRAVFQPILYYPRNAVLVFLWGTALCLGASFMLRKPINLINRLKNKLFPA